MAEYFDRKDDYGYVRWAQEVKKRDHYTCTICGRKGVALNSHHLNSWADHPSERYDVSNGTTLCTYHHQNFHKLKGKGKNTLAQFEEYRKIAETIIAVTKEECIKDFTVRKLLQTAEKDMVIQAILADLELNNGIVERLTDGYSE